MSSYPIKVVLSNPIDTNVINKIYTKALSSIIVNKLNIHSIDDFMTLLKSYENIKR